MIKKPFVIVLGHEKGGTGKSTLCAHIVVGLLYHNPQFKIVVLDADIRQSNTYRFFQSRKHGLPMPIHFDTLVPSADDSKQKAQYADAMNLFILQTKYYDADFIIIDTAGSLNNFTVFSIGIAHLLITPISDSFIDIDVLVRLDSHQVIRGPYSEIVFEQKQMRLVNKNPSPFNWVLVRNKISTLTNSPNFINALEKIATNINAVLGPAIPDRLVFKETFQHGITIFDLPKLTTDISVLKLRAYGEMQALITMILKYETNYKEFMHYKSNISY